LFEKELSLFIVRFIHEDQGFTAVHAIWTGEIRGGGNGTDAITSEGSSPVSISLFDHIRAYIESIH
jgi:hypothetical protein